MLIKEAKAVVHEMVRERVEPLGFAWEKTGVKWRPRAFIRMVGEARQQLHVDVVKWGATSFTVDFWLEVVIAPLVAIERAWCESEAAQRLSLHEPQLATVSAHRFRHEDDCPGFHFGSPADLAEQASHLDQIVTAMSAWFATMSHLDTLQTYLETLDPDSKAVFGAQRERALLQLYAHRDDARARAYAESLLARPLGSVFWDSVMRLPALLLLERADDAAITAIRDYREAEKAPRPPPPLRPRANNDDVPDKLRCAALYAFSELASEKASAALSDVLVQLQTFARAPAKCFIEVLSGGATVKTRAHEKFHAVADALPLLQQLIAADAAFHFWVNWPKHTYADPPTYRLEYDVRNLAKAGPPRLSREIALAVTRAALPDAAATRALLSDIFAMFEGSLAFLEEDALWQHEAPRASGAEVSDFFGSRMAALTYDLARAGKRPPTIRDVNRGDVLLSAKSAARLPKEAHVESLANGVVYLAREDVTDAVRAALDTPL